MHRTRRHAATMLVALVVPLNLGGCANQPLASTGSVLSEQNDSLTKTTVACPCVYVANELGHRVTVYPISARGNAPPVAEISGRFTGLAIPEEVAFDGSGNIYVANYFGGGSSRGSVTVYPAGANGNVVPTRTITGPNTGLANPAGVAVDSSGTTYVANSGGQSLTVYAPGSNGNVYPIQTVKGSKTGLASPSELMVSGSLIFVPNANPAVNSVTVYSSNANGNVVPVQTIVGSATGLSEPSQVTVDSSGKIYVANGSGGSTGLGSVTVYPPGANGNVAPLQTISGSSTKMDSSLGIALDSAKNMYVTNFKRLSLTVYAAGSNGNVAPMRTIKGRETKLAEPRGITVH